MPQGVLVRRATLFILTGPNPHLHVVMNDPAMNPITGEESVVVVNFCTYHPDRGHDATCLLNSGDHGFIQRETYVDYPRAAVKRVARLEEALANPDVEIHLHHEPVTENVYDRILRGFSESDHVEPRVLRFLKHAGCIG